jgi:hypothetical protein
VSFQNISEMAVCYGAIKMLDGSRIIRQREIQQIADALGLNADYLLHCFDAQREAQMKTQALLLSGGFFDSLGWMDNYISLAERLRIEGAPGEALQHLNAIIKQLRVFLERQQPVDKPPLFRLLEKALVSRAACFTLMHDNSHKLLSIVSQIHLDEIMDLQSFLTGEDAHHQDLGYGLPAMTWYLAGENERAAGWIRTHLPRVQGPYVRGMMLRDQLVMAGKQQQMQVYRQVTRQANGLLQRGLLDASSQARVWEGAARAVTYLGLPGADDYLCQAEEAYGEAMQMEGRQPFIPAQIARTKVQHLVSQNLLDEPTIIATAQAGIPQFRAGHYQRQLTQMRQMLLATKSEALVDYARSVLI